MFIKAKFGMTWVGPFLSHSEAVNLLTELIKDKEGKGKPAGDENVERKNDQIIFFFCSFL